MQQICVLAIHLAIAPFTAAPVCQFAVAIQIALPALPVLPALPAGITGIPVRRVRYNLKPEV